MYRVGICDDNADFCSLLESYMEEIASELHITVDTEVFCSGEDFLKSTKECPFDLFFLDIELGKMNGIEVGNKIRELSESDLTEIVFISGNENYAMQLFKIRPMDFLIKPLKKADIRRILKEYVRADNRKKRYFEYMVNKQVYRIDTASVLYFQSMGRKVHIRLKQGREITFYEKLSDLICRLDTNVFWSIHKSYLVNVHYVTMFCPDHVVLTTGEELPISQSMRKEVNARLQLSSKSARGKKEK